MAILQISRIQLRRGLKEQLPQLAGAEMGWAVDTRELYIGNSTSIDSPLPNAKTRILTELDLQGQAFFLGNITLLSGAISNVAVVIEPSLNSIIVNYSLTSNVDMRTGSMKISSNVAGTSLTYVDDYSESGNLGITLTPSVTAIPGQITLLYTSTNSSNVNLITNSIKFT